MLTTIPTNNLHRLACEALVNAGAIPCESLLDYEDSKKVSDAAFVAEKVIFEVKTFTTDRAKDLAFQKKLRAAVEEHLPGGLNALNQLDAFFGLPDHIANRLTLELGKRAKSNIDYANRQIIETAQRLEWQGVRGGLMFLVPAHFGVHPQALARVALLQMGKTAFPHINSILFISVPTDGIQPIFPPAFIPCYRSKLPRIPKEIPEKIGVEWIKVFERETNARVALLHGREDDLDQIYFNHRSST